MEEFLGAFTVASILFIIPLGGVVSSVVAARIRRNVSLTAVFRGIDRGEEKAEVEEGIVAEVESQPSGTARVLRSAREVLRRFEETAGRQWMTWAGAAVLFAGVVFFVKYAADHGWFGPTFRVSFAAALGLFLTGAGVRFVRREAGPLGKALMGVGLSITTLSIYAAHGMYDLIPTSAAFALLVITAAGGLTLSLIHDTLSVSIVSTVCALATPIFLMDGLGHRDATMAYILLVDLTVLTTAFFKRWRALDVLAFVGTWAVFAVWFAESYDAGQKTPALLWAGVFFALFSVLPAAGHLLERSKMRGERLAVLVLNAAAGLAAATLVLEEPETALGAWCAAMGIVYVVIGGFVRLRNPRDAVCYHLANGLGAGLLVTGAPMIVSQDALPPALAATGLIFASLGTFLDYFPARVSGFGVLVAGGLTAAFQVQGPSLQDGAYPLLANPDFGVSLAVCAAFAAFAVLQGLRMKTARSRADMVMMRMGGLTAAFGLLASSSEDLIRWGAAMDSEYLALASLPLMWASGALALVFTSRRTGSRTVYVGALAALATGVAFAVTSYLVPQPGWYSVVDNPRFLGAVILAWVPLVFKILGEKPRWLAELYKVLFIAMFLGALSAETYAGPFSVLDDPQRAGRAALTALTLVWAVYGAAALIAGFAKDSRTVRLAALGIFAVAVTKLAIFDLSALEEGYRIVSFAALGLTMVGGSYLYHRAQRRLQSKDAHV